MPSDTHDRDEVRRLIDQGVQIVDVLGADEFAKDHLPGAVNLPLRKIETKATRLLDTTRPVLVYCFDSA
jgi:rhodanese-related sulfurtransferase